MLYTFFIRTVNFELMLAVLYILGILVSIVLVFNHKHYYASSLIACLYDQNKSDFFHPIRAF